MPLPPKDNMHLPLLKALNDAGGSLSAHDAMEQVKKYYKELTPDDLAGRLDSGGNRLNNRIRWAKQDLVLSGDCERSTTGIWKITDKGKQRFEKEWSSWKPEYYNTPASNVTARAAGSAQATVRITSQEGDPHELVEQARRELVKSVEAEMLERLHTIDPSDFERMIADLLEKLEYGSIADGTIKVTGRSGDGGIDGECALDRLGLYKTMFQAKRWTKPVSPDDLRGFIGALNIKRVDQGIFVTASDFSQQARNEALQSGKVKLIDGKALAKVMVEVGLGVRKTPLDIPRIDEDYFTGLV